MTHYSTHLLTTMLSSKEFKGYYDQHEVVAKCDGTTAVIVDKETNQAYRVEITVLNIKGESDAREETKPSDENVVNIRGNGPTTQKRV